MVTDSILYPCLEHIIQNDPKIPRGFGDLLKENTINKCIEIEVNKKYIQAMGITKLPDLHKKLYTSPWMIVHNHTNIPFITSDNPSIVDDGNILIPLTPKMAICIKPLPSENETTMQNIDRYQHKEDGYCYADKKFIRFLNKRIIICAENIVVHSNQEPWLKKLVNKYRGWKVYNVNTKTSFQNGRLIVNKQEALDKPA